MERFSCFWLSIGPPVVEDGAATLVTKRESGGAVLPCWSNELSDLVPASDAILTLSVLKVIMFAVTFIDVLSVLKCNDEFLVTTAELKTDVNGVNVAVDAFAVFASVALFLLVWTNV